MVKSEPLRQNQSVYSASDGEDQPQLIRHPQPATEQLFMHPKDSENSESYRLWAAAQGLRDASFDLQTGVMSFRDKEK